MQVDVGHKIFYQKIKMREVLVVEGGLKWREYWENEMNEQGGGGQIKIERMQWKNKKNNEVGG